MLSFIFHHYISKSNMGCGEMWPESFSTSQKATGTLRRFYKKGQGWDGPGYSPIAITIYCIYLRQVDSPFAELISFTYISSEPSLQHLTMNALVGSKGDYYRKSLLIRWPHIELTRK